MVAESEAVVAVFADFPNVADFADVGGDVVVAAGGSVVADLDSEGFSTDVT